MFWGEKKKGLGKQTLHNSSQKEWEKVEWNWVFFCLCHGEFIHWISKVATTSLFMMNEVRKSHGLYINDRKNLKSHLISSSSVISKYLCVRWVNKAAFPGRGSHNVSRHYWVNNVDQGLYWVINPFPQCTWWLILKGPCKFYLFLYVFFDCDKWVRYIEPHFKNSYFGRKVPFLLWKWLDMVWKDVD